MQPRENDEVIMRAFLDANLSLEILGTLNKCWLFFKALFLSDIVDAEGKLILDEAWVGKPMNLYRCESWPYQGKLPDSARGSYFSPEGGG